MINNTATIVPPRLDIQMERTGILAFESSEDATVMLKMGAVVHAGLDTVKEDSVHVAPGVVLLYRVANCQEGPNLRTEGGAKEQVLDDICTSGGFHVRYQAPGRLTIQTNIPRAYEPCCGRDKSPYALPCLSAT